MKCEWCEKKEDMLMSHEEIGVIYRMNLTYDYENEPIIEITKQKVPSSAREVKCTKRISYCPFCGKKLEKYNE